MSDQPTVRILLLGDPSCGKSTFLSALGTGKNSTREPTTTPVQLRDLDQPFTWTFSLYARPYTFEFSDTASPTHYTLLNPDFIILCYAIDDRNSLVNLQNVWWKIVLEKYKDDIPVMVLGLKRDLRTEGGVMPLEGVRVARELRVDRYAECSAVTGELLDEVVEDLARVGAKTCTEGGGRSGGGCVVC